MDFLPSGHLIYMPAEADFSKRISEALVENEKTSIIYQYDDGELEINRQRYDIGQLSFSKVANAILLNLRNLYGDYKTIPYSFNSEAYENELFKAEVLALGGLGLLEFTVYKKR